MSAQIDPSEFQDAWLRRIVTFGKAALPARLAESYERNDTDANRLRGTHRSITLLCVGAGTVALVLSVALLAAGSLIKTPDEAAVTRSRSTMLFHPHGGTAWLVMELILVLFTIFGVVKGYYQRTRDQWLFSRYLAERFRSASFQVLIQPRFWGPIEPVLAEWHSALETEKSRIDSLLNADEAAEHDEELIVPEPEVCASTMSEFTRRLGTHYRERRLEPQIDYLDRLVARRRIWYDNPVVQPTVFIVSVVAVLLHAAFEWDGRETASVVFVFLAAALPIVWTGIRTWRGANEQARNVSRSRAKAEILRARSEWLKTELAAAETPNALHVFTVLAISENLLRNELREWLRLMLETEWYG